ncbi:MAG: ATP-binding protein [Gemmatales bacterium]|nr:ATP-binding protein [Gemmatales bacterium]MDW7994182.1 ATP-binding protein [Gemmatales bacterium]
MSYRRFKRLLGETYLERKCLLLFGTATLILITASFWYYAYVTEGIVYEQARITGRLLVYQALLRLHLEKWGENLTKLEAPQWELLEQIRQRISGLSRLAPEGLIYKTDIIPVDSEDQTHRSILEDFYHNPERRESGFYLDATADPPYNYVFRAALWGDARCISCHQQQKVRTRGTLAPRATPEEDRAFFGVASVSMSTKELDEEIHKNRAILFATALVTVLLLMGGNYLIVRYVVVKPIKHLKEVSDAISAGQLNVRSEIQTGDEFEDLSHAFNRMIRTLVSMQDQLRRVNADLDRKVDELAQANMALYQSNKLKDDFLATVSHELRTPLNSILGFSEVLLSSEPPLSERQKRWVLNIQTSGQQLLNLINDVLDLAKMEAGRMEVRVEEFPIHEVVDTMLNMFRPLAERKNLALASEIEPGIPTVKQDPNKIQQILWNLLSNAIKFTPEGGRVCVRVETDGVHLILSVIDTGIGIAPEDQEKVFEKFRQVGQALTREQSGTGLGLSIVRELAKLLGGNVSLKSELGRGSTFIVTLPLHLEPKPISSMDGGEPTDLRNLVGRYGVTWKPRKETHDKQT